MSQIDRNIAYNLKRIRKSRNMSLDMLAEKTGVSKSMLGQIERGESNPTVATISRIMEGVKVSFEDLIYKPEEEVVAVEKKNLSVYKEKEGEYKIQVVFPYSRDRSFELFYLEIEPECRFAGNNYGENSWLYISVYQGEIAVTLEDQQYLISEGNALRFPAFKEHVIANAGIRKAAGYLILSHGEGSN